MVLVVAVEPIVCNVNDWVVEGAEGSGSFIARIKGDWATPVFHTAPDTPATGPFLVKIVVTLFVSVPSISVSNMSYIKPQWATSLG